jgi:hypothetical protein
MAVRKQNIPLPQNQHMFTLFFSDDQITISNTEENMQEAAYKSNQTITERGVTISAQKTKLMAFKGRDTIGSKIVTEKRNCRTILLTT